MHVLATKLIPDVHDQTIMSAHYHHEAVSVLGPEFGV